jgi:DNA-binding CsgD family transcriptional regulator
MRLNDGQWQPPVGGRELWGLAESLFGARDLPDLARRFQVSFPPLFDVPMHGLYVIEPWRGEPQIVASANVSDYFLACYEGEGREVDTLNRHLLETGKPAYNLDLMPMGEWLEHPLYRRVKRIHDVRHEIQAPAVSRDGIVGNINFGTSDPQRGFTAQEVRLAKALGRLVGAAVERVHYNERIERERDQAQVALQLLDAAIVVSEAAREPRLNEAAQRLLAQLVDGEVQLHRLLARSGSRSGAAPGTRVLRHAEVDLANGGSGILCAESRLDAENPSTLVTVLELQRDGYEISERVLAALTPREREVALRVVNGLGDREVAERLFLSPHTVRQHVKRIYRKLDVDSRVGLTRLLLGRRGTDRR